MKRLVDSSTSDFSRSLLNAGIEHQPPPHGQLKVLVALGVGGGLTLAASKALAWLATTAGKGTILATAIAVGSATVYLTNDGAPTSALRATWQDAPSSSQAVDEAATISIPRAAKPSKPSEVAASAVTTPPAAFPLDVAPPKVALEGRTAKRTNRRTNRHVEKPSKIASRRAGDLPVQLTPKQESHQWLPALEQEIELVDKIRLAVEANDGTHLRMARRYHRLYPKGQLKIEVERLCQPN